MPTVDEHTISPAGDPFYAASRCTDQGHEDRLCYCYGSGVVVLTVEEDGREHDLVVPCRRCNLGTAVSK
jgi:hypothetical protein